MKTNMITAFLLIFLVIPALCSAHVGMLNSNPVENGIVSPPPETVTIKFAGELEPAFSRIEVFSPDNKKVSKKTRFLKENRVMETHLKGTLIPGVYTVKWKCMSLDGHALSGEYTFTIE